MLQMNPCKEDDLQCLNKILEMVPPAIELAKAGLEVGWNMQDFIDQLQAQLAMATKAKAKFFPSSS